MTEYETIKKFFGQVESYRIDRRPLDLRIFIDDEGSTHLQSLVTVTSTTIDGSSFGGTVWINVPLSLVY